MAAESSPKARGRFLLLDLPREIRDLIYTAVLVREFVDIKAAACHTAARDINTKHHDPDDLRNPVRFRTTWLWSRHLPPLSCATYQQAYYTDYDDYPILNIFYVSRQVYREAFPIYYSKNTFHFMLRGNSSTISSINSCLAFLKDRPPLALLEIRSIELRLGGVISTPSCGWMDYDAWEPLMVIIKSCMKLERLALSLSGWVPDVRQNPWKWAPASDSSNNTAPRKWVRSLLTLRNLKALQVDISTDHYENRASDNAIVRGVAFIRLLRSRMLKNGASLGGRNIRVESRHATDFFTGHRTPGRWIRVEAHDDEHGQSKLVKRIRTSIDLGKELKADITMPEGVQEPDGSHPLEPTGRQTAEDEKSSQEDGGDSEKSYTGSDGGDNDSLISLHGWSDDEDIAETNDGYKAGEEEE